MSFLSMIEILIFVLILSAFTRGQSVKSRPRNSIFNRKCPPQLDMGIYICIRKHLIDVPDDIHSQTKLLDLTGNQITTLHESNFVNLQKLLRLVLDENRIWKITQNTFLPLAHLTELSLKNNHLSISILNSITNRILAPLLSLKRLDLSYNQLGVITDDLFMNSSTINSLVLDSAGKPLQLTINSFYYLPKLEMLSLENNELTMLPEGIFRRQTNLDINNIRLANNPWNCNCSLKWLRMTLESIILSKQLNPDSESPSVLHKKHNPSCFMPLQFKGFPMFQVPLNSFQCQTKVFTPQNNITTFIGLETSLVCVFHFAKHANSSITWYHNNKRIVPSTRTHSQNSYSTNITSIFNISSVSYQDSGVYHCQIQAGKEFIKTTIYLNVVKSSDEIVISGIRVIFTIGTILASFIIVIVAVLAIVYLIKHRSLFCSDDSKFYPEQHSKPNEREIKNQDSILNQISRSQPPNISQIDQTLSLLPCSRHEYLTLQSAHHNYSRQPYLILPKPAFQCTHNHQFILNQTANLSGDYSFDSTMEPCQPNRDNCDTCATCTPLETGTEIDPYQKCPIHGIQSETETQSILSRSATNSLNVNCPLHGYKSDNLFYYELSNNYK